MQAFHRRGEFFKVVPCRIILRENEGLVIVKPIISVLKAVSVDFRNSNVIFFCYDVFDMLYIQLICVTAARCVLCAMSGQATDLIPRRTWVTTFRIDLFCSPPKKK